MRFTRSRGIAASNSIPRKRRNIFIGLVGAVTLLFSTVPAAASFADPAVTGTVDTVTLPSGAQAFVYVPDGIQLVSWTAPIVLVLGDEDFTAATAKTLAEESELAANAKADNAVITFVNSIGDDWGVADVTAYDEIVSRLYIERPTPSTWANGRANGLSNGRGAAYPVVYQGYDFRISLIAEGGGADFVSTHLVNDTLAMPLAALGTWLPASVLLFNTTAVPTAQYREFPATVINGSAEANTKYTSLSRAPHRLSIGTSETTDGFDTALIAQYYAQLTSVRRQQLMAGGVSSPADNASNNFVLDIGDYEALGVAPEQINLTLAPSRAAMYLAYVPDTVADDPAGTVPLVMLFHGSGERAEWIAMHTEWPTLAAQEEFIVVAVDDHIGQRTPGNMTTAQIVQLMEDVFTRYPEIDRTRVYATGFSLGSARTINMGTQRPDLFAAIAPVDVATNPVGTNDALILPTMYFGGEADGFPSIFPRHTAAAYSGTLNSADRTINQLFKVNKIRGGTYTYSTAGANSWWGLTFDDVETVPATNGISVFTVNSLRSPDGNVYTKLVNVSAKNHFTFPDEAVLAWEFMSQFSRNADGSVSIDENPDVQISVASRCVAGKSQLTVTTVNTDDVPVALSYQTVYGTKAFPAVLPGKSGFHTFTTRLASLPVGTATITASAVIDGETVTITKIVDYTAKSCN